MNSQNLAKLPRIMFVLAVIVAPILTATAKVVITTNGVEAPQPLSKREQQKISERLKKEAEEKEKRKVERQKNNVTLSNIDSLLSSARYSTFIQMHQDMNTVTQEILDERKPFVKIPIGSSGTVQITALTLSALLGGRVELSDDDNGRFFNANDSEQMEVRPRKVLPAFVTEYIPEAQAKEVKTCDGFKDAFECYNASMNYQYHQMSKKPGSGLNFNQFENQQYTKLGALRHMIAWTYLKHLYQTYGMLKDYGVKNIRLSFKSNQDGRVSVSGDTLDIRIGYKQFNAGSGEGRTFEEFNLKGKDILGIRLTNWWKHREYDANALVSMIDGAPKYSWRENVSTIILSAGGALIRDSHQVQSQMDSVMTVGPARDSNVRNYYLQVHSPDADRIEMEVHKALNRKTMDYPRSFIAEAATQFAKISYIVETQNEDVAEEEKELLQNMSLKDKDGKELPDEAKREAILTGRLNAFFAGKMLNTGKRVATDLVHSGGIQNPEVIDWLDATKE